MQKLEAGGFCASVLHAVDPFPPARRFHLTAAGLRRLAGEEDTSLDELVRSRPVSAQWRRGLMERLDALAAVYHLACLLSNVAFPIRFRWYRAVRMDAAVTLPDGKTAGIVRQGRTADRSGFAKRLWRLRLPYVSLLPGDFTDRLERLKEASGLSWSGFAKAIGIDYKQMYRWHNDGVEPSGGAYHSLVLFASRIPGGLHILFGEGFQMTFFKD